MTLHVLHVLLFVLRKSITFTPPPNYIFFANGISYPPNIKANPAKKANISVGIVAYAFPMSMPDFTQKECFCGTSLLSLTKAFLSKGTHLKRFLSPLLSFLGLILGFPFMKHAMFCHNMYIFILQVLLWLIQKSLGTKSQLLGIENNMMEGFLKVSKATRR